jgi:hypothetical protein
VVKSEQSRMRRLTQGLTLCALLGIALGCRPGASGTPTPAVRDFQLRLKPYTYIADVSPDGGTLLLLHDDKAISICKIDQNADAFIKPTGEVLKHDSTVRWAFYVDNGRYIVSSTGYSLFMWDAVTRQLLKQTKSEDLLGPSVGQIYRGAAGPGKDNVTIVGSYAGAFVLPLSTWRPHLLPHVGAPAGSEILGDFRSETEGAVYICLDKNGSTHVYEAKSATQVKVLPQERGVRIVWSQSGSTFALNEGGTLMKLDGSSWKQVMRLGGGLAELCEISVSGDLAAVSDQSEAWLINVAEGKVVWRSGAGLGVTALLVPNSALLIATDESGRFQMIDASASFE